MKRSSLVHWLWVHLNKGVVTDLSVTDDFGNQVVLTDKTVINITLM